MPQEKLKPRSAKRYPYVCEGQVTFGNELHGIRLKDLSSSGIQFEAKDQISINIPAKILWTDEKSGILSANTYIVREIFNPKAEYKYIYGAQYHKLEPDSKKKLVNLIGRVRDEIAEQLLKKVEEATPNYLLDTATESSARLKEFLSGEKKPRPLVAKVIEELAEYEKSSFQIDNEFNRLIQSYCTFTFHCKVLETLTPLMFDKRELKRGFYQTASSVLKSIEKFNEEIEKAPDLITKLNLNDEDKKIALDQFAQSKKRNFYAKQDMLRKVRKHFASDEKDLEYVEAFEVIAIEYGKVMETVKQNSLAAVLTKQRSLSTFNPYITQVEKSKTGEYIVDDQPLPGYTQKTILLLLLAILLASIITIIKYW